MLAIVHVIMVSLKRFSLVGFHGDLFSFWNHAATYLLSWYKQRDYF